MLSRDPRSAQPRGAVGVIALPARPIAPPPYREAASAALPAFGTGK